MERIVTMARRNTIFEGICAFWEPTTALTPPPRPTASAQRRINHTSNPIGIMSDARHGFDEGGNSNAIIPSPGQPSPGQKLLSSMVLGDGSFEASMKERSRVSSSKSHIAYSPLNSIHVIPPNTLHPSSADEKGKRRTFPGPGGDSTDRRRESSHG